MKWSKKVFIFRNWQKHQKKVRQIRDRIHGMNEQSLYGLDDDDIEDIYEDLDDIEVSLGI